MKVGIITSVWTKIGEKIFDEPPNEFCFWEFICAMILVVLSVFFVFLIFNI